MTQIVEPIQAEGPDRAATAVDQRRRRRGSLVGAALVLLIAVVAVVVARSGGTSTPKVRVTASERDFAVSLAQPSVAAGAIRLHVDNAGPTVHEIHAFRTDLPETALPLDGNRVNEDGPGITHIDPEAEDVPIGGAKEVTLHPGAGRYALSC